MGSTAKISAGRPLGAIGQRRTAWEDGDGKPNSIQHEVAEWWLSGLVAVGA
jgi:hypothetical protein